MEIFGANNKKNERKKERKKRRPIKLSRRGKAVELLKADYKEFIISKLPHLIRKYQLLKRGGLLLFRTSGFTDTLD